MKRIVELENIIIKALNDGEHSIRIQAAVELDNLLHPKDQGNGERVSRCFCEPFTREQMN